MKDFFNQTWVRIVAAVFIVLGTVALILGGTAVGEIVKIPTLVAGILQAIGLLVTFIAGLLNKKEAD
jgi:hypothetical protein